MPIPQPLKILFISDGSLDRPLLHSQGIPLLRRLAETGVTCFIQSFEDREDAQDSPLGRDLAERGIHWLPVALQGKSNNIQRVGMIANGFLNALKLVKKEKIDVIHCRSYRPAVIGCLLKAFTGTGFLWDMRGFLIDELVADRLWKTDSTKYFIGKKVEGWCLQNSDVITTTSPQFRDRVLSMPIVKSHVKPQNIFSIPNCVDTERFQFNLESRLSIREKHGWVNRTVFAFAGDAKRYGDTLPQMLAFFSMAKSFCQGAFLAVFLNGAKENAIRSIDEYGIPSLDYQVLNVLPSDIPDYLSAVDIGISFFKIRNFANAIASPVKFAEYLACGLPCVINPGIGDTERIILQHHVGVVVDPTHPEELKRGVDQILSFVKGDPNIHERCRTAAVQELSLDWALQEYQTAYRAVANKCSGRLKG